MTHVAGSVVEEDSGTMDVEGVLKRMLHINTSIGLLAVTDGRRQSLVINIALLRDADLLQMQVEYSNLPLHFFALGLLGEFSYIDEDAQFAPLQIPLPGTALPALSISHG